MKHAWGWLQKDTNVMGVCILYLEKACEKVWVHIQHAGYTMHVTVMYGEECVVLGCVVLCFVVLCCVTLGWAVLCCVVLGRVIRRVIL